MDLDDGSGAGPPQRLELLARDAQGAGSIHQTEGKTDTGDGAGKVDRVVGDGHCRFCWAESGSVRVRPTAGRTQAAFWTATIVTSLLARPPQPQSRPA